VHAAVAALPLVEVPVSAPLPRSDRPRDVRSLRSVTLLAATLAVALLVALLPSPVPVEASTRTPVMQRERLTAAEMTAWFRDHEPRSTSYRASVPVAELAQLFVEEGRAEGVAGDLAFAQSVLETGWFRWPSHGQVTPTHNNFGGIGACDGGTCTVARFPSARIGARAQIQHLRAYADPTVTTSNLAYPLESPRFHLVLPKGRAPYWEQFGSGNWATDPAYGSKILTLHRSMLTYATAEVAATSRFLDVPTTATHHDAIETLAVAGILGGHPDGTFRPADPVSRAQLATLLVRSLELPGGTAHGFSDVRGAHEAAIAAVAAAGIMTGYPDGTFRPERAVTRAQLASTLRAGLGLPPAVPSFTDVPLDHLHAGSIGGAAAAGIVTGRSDGTFAPGLAVTRAQAAMTIERALR
jgi:hypothetical protein